MTNCWNCGQPLEERDTFCRKCGANVPVASSLQPPVPPPDASAPPEGDKIWDTKDDSFFTQNANTPVFYNGAQQVPQQPTQQSLNQPPPTAGNYAGSPYPPQMPPQPNMPPLNPAQMPQPGMIGGQYPPMYPPNNPPGHPAYGAQKPVQVQTKNSKKIILFVVGGFVLLLAIAVFLLSMALRPKEKGVQKAFPFGQQQMASVNTGDVLPEYGAVFVKGRQSVYVSTNGEKIMLGDGSSTYDMIGQTSDGKWTAYLSKNDATYDKALYITDSVNAPVLLAEDASDVLLCANGDTIYYRAYDENSDRALWCYTISTKEKAFLQMSYGMDYAASPNGRYAMLSSENKIEIVDMDTQETVTAVKSPADITPISVSNDGKVFLYFTRGSGGPSKYTYYVCKDGGAEPVATLGTSGWNREIYLNKEADDIVFAFESGLYRYNNGKMWRIDKGDDAATVWTGTLLGSCNTEIGSGVGVYDTDSFANFFYSIEGSKNSTGERKRSIFYLHTNGRIEEASNKVGYSEEAQLAADGNALYFEESYGGQGLVKASIQEGETLAVEQIAPEVERFVVSPDGKTVYYSVRAGTMYDISMHDLYKWQDNAELEEIATGITTFEAGGKDFTSCTYLVGGSPYDNITGTAFLYTAEQGSVEIAQDTLYIQPPTTNNSFFVLTNPIVLPESEYLKSLDIYLYSGDELEEIGQKTEEFSTFAEAQWYQNIRGRKDNR